GSQLPQQPGERKRMLFRHHPHAPYRACPRPPARAGTAIPTQYAGPATPAIPATRPAAVAGPPRSPPAPYRGRHRGPAGGLRGHMRGRSRVGNPPADRDGGTSRDTGPPATPDTEEAAMNPTRVTHRLSVILAGSRPPPGAARLPRHRHRSHSPATP